MGRLKIFDLQCLDCEAKQGSSGHVVFLICEDIKGEFPLCSACWTIRHDDAKEQPEEPVRSSKKRRRKR